METSELQRRADALRPWRYNHSARDVTIQGAVESAPIHGSLGHGRAVMVDLVRGVIGDRNPANLRALDLGCLEGHYTDVLAEAGFGEVLGIEWSREHAERARFLLNDLKQHRNVRILEGDVEDPSLYTSIGNFDVVLFHGLLYHMRNPVAVIERIHHLAPPGRLLHLLLSTQFKFPFSEIADPAALANIKVRKLRVEADGRVQSKADLSVYAPVAVRLNPSAVRGVLAAAGFCDPIAYDTPTGAQYGFQLQLVTSTALDSGLIERLSAASTVPSVSFYEWNGRRLDGYDLDAPIGRAAAFGAKLVRALSEKFGGSGARQSRRETISE